MADQDYQHAGTILKTAIEQMFDDGIPEEELPPLLAGFATMFAFGIGKTEGTLAILMRMSEYADPTLTAASTFEPVSKNLPG